ncbi:acetolactate synthase large subunit [Roseobacter denitrificans]|uniref:Acetolactate synthase n=1 Tax=Roseobacter denitrificans (strain ATCC 33942 / OCh 114) TaxID=375451 RepID=Q166S8_ROSDO|nr:acetolactate synthase large subunit [Roseobacter denitrificans]ABG32015.1 acetolactate synthase [Roseobacter denitrificans OCh 114]AVL51546.1 acetolactate synthase large subunit [Roseobacter denitrificans]SFG36352.1 acetolactate synthase-1/2/3 large subunit [Roseobacter denitrificans OCh 114]
MNIAELIVASLEKAGVIAAFGVPGEENTHLMQALEASRIEVILTRHEQAAAFMASVHARITGKPAMCFATLGPGATNLITGVADAQLDHAPMFVVTGQGARERIGKTVSHQLIDLERLFKPVTKFSRTLMHKDEVSGLVAEALRRAQDPHPGAVHLSLPEDLAGEQTDARPKSAPEPLPATAAPKAIGDALEILKSAQHPMIVAGNGVIRARAGHDVQLFAEATGIPLATTFMAKGILPADHPLHLHCVGQPFEDHIDKAFRTRDLIIAVGFDPVEVPPQSITAGGAIPVLHVGENPAALEHDWFIRGDVAGDVAKTMRSLTAGLDGRTWEEDDRIVAVRKEITEQRTRHHGSDDNALHPADVLRKIEASLTHDTFVVSGVGTHKMEVARYLAARKPNQIIIPNGLAGMGLALPGAIAAAHLGRHGRVMAICGDGEFLMNVQEMETADRLGLSLTVVMFEDKGYGLIKAKQQADTGGHTPLSFGNPEWDSLATSFGWQHIRTETLETLETALEDQRTGLTLITLPIDYGDALKKDSSPV